MTAHSIENWGKWGEGKLINIEVFTLRKEEWKGLDGKMKKQKRKRARKKKKKKKRNKLYLNASFYL